jgi:hypothetical protein
VCYGELNEYCFFLFFSLSLVSQAVIYARGRRVTCEAATTLFFTGTATMCISPDRHSSVGLSRQQNSGDEVCWLELDTCVWVGGALQPDWPQGRAVSDVFVCPTDQDNNRYTCSLQDTSHTIPPSTTNLHVARFSAVMASLLLLADVALVVSSVYRWCNICRAARMEQKAQELVYESSIA